MREGVDGVDEGRRSFLKLAGKGLLFFAAGQSLTLASITKAFASREWGELDLQGKLERLREGLGAGGPIRKWLEKTPPPKSHEVLQFFEQLLPITEAMEAAERDVSRAPRFIKEHLVDAESIPNLFKITFTLRPEHKKPGKGEAKMGNGYITQFGGRGYLVTAKHCIEDTLAEKHFFHLDSVLFDPDIVVIALTDLERLEDKRVIKGPQDFEPTSADVFTTFAGEMHGEYWVSTRLSIPICEATAAFIHDYTQGNQMPAARDASIKYITQVGGDISLGPSSFLDPTPTRDAVLGQGRSGSLTIAEDMKTKELYACGTFYAVGNKKVPQLGNRALLLSTDKLDLKNTLEKAHEEYASGRRLPVSLGAIPGVRLTPISRKKKLEPIDAPKPRLVRDGRANKS